MLAPLGTRLDARIRCSRRWTACFVALFLLLLAVGCAAAAPAADKACTDCHGEYAKKRFVHGALEMGCSRCHSELDASRTPHVSKGRRPMGLGSEQFAMCTQCHERAAYEGKHVHAPVGSGNCLGCHDAHASDQIGLLTKEPLALCLDCHPETRQAPHLVAGFSRSGHPLGEPTQGKLAADPLRPGRAFYCVSCHEPHRSDEPSLSRVGRGMNSCVKCHRK